MDLRPNGPFAKRLARAVVATLAALTTGAALADDSSADPPPHAWVPLFDGATLDGWTPKIAGYPLGENHADTFRVEDGVLKCEYDDYTGPFADRYGHLFTDVAYAHYVLRLEYRFVGRMLPDAKRFVDRNSGVMVHAQPPQSMGLHQGFPASLEMQFLATVEGEDRHTGNLCTPGTHVSIDGEPVTRHIVPSSAPARPADDWVRVEVEVRGHDLVIHRVEGREVLRYTHPVLDPDDARGGASLVARGADRRLGSGHIALQAEGQRVWFRRIALRPLDP